MTKVTREMIAAAHDVTMQHKIVLGHELLTEIYQAMDAKREFVGLMDEEVDYIMARNDPHCDEINFARAIEAKLKERNT